MRAALVTGATSGIGLEFVKIFARHNVPVVLVGRDQQKLDRLKDWLARHYHGASMTVCVQLAQEGAAEQVFAATQKAGWEVEYLINNAGFGDWNVFVESDWAKQAEMIRLNILTLTAMCRFYGQEMRRRGSGRILNIASVAAFIPGPYMAVYYASKSYVLQFSRALAEELRADGVTVTALCPAPTKTGFEQRANLTKGSTLFQHTPQDSPKSCAEYGYRAMIQGKVTACPTLLSRMIRIAGKLAPSSVAARETGRLNGNPEILAK